jgi:GTP cyclohydrolase II
MDATTRSLRSVHRVASDLRRGTPVLLRGDDNDFVIAAAETVGAGGLAEIAACAAAPPMLLVAPTRAVALRGAAVAVPRRAGVVPLPAAAASAEAVALRLPPGLLDPGMLRGLADPTIEAVLPDALEPMRDTPPSAAAALALAKLARLLPAVVAAPAHDAPELGLLSVGVAEILAYPTAAASSLRPVAEAAVPLDGASDARLVAFRAADGGIEHLAILVGRPDEVAARSSGKAPLARLHSECFTGDLLGSLRCDCGAQLRGAVRRMAEEGAGVLLYLAQEGRGIGLVNKLRAYRLQDGGLDTLDANRALGWSADERNFLVAAAMLEHLGVPRIRLLTNNPDKLAGLAACGIRVEGREAHAFPPNGVNDGYLETKARRFGHLLA